MYEFHIRHVYCDITTIIFGYDFYNACHRSKIDPKLWEVELMEYVD